MGGLSPRRELILRLLNRGTIRNQRELLSELEKNGFNLTQSTLSRELKALGVAKGPDGRGSYIYILGGPGDAVLPATRNFVRSINRADNLLIIKTPPGNAQGVARELDQADWPDVLGTIAGDDTILMICARENVARDVEDRLRRVTRLEI